MICEFPISSSLLALAVLAPAMLRAQIAPSAEAPNFELYGGYSYVFHQ